MYTILIAEFIHVKQYLSNSILFFITTYRMTLVSHNDNFGLMFRVHREVFPDVSAVMAYASPCLQQLLSIIYKKYSYL